MEVEQTTVVGKGSFFGCRPNDIQMTYMILCFVLFFINILLICEDIQGCIVILAPAVRTNGVFLPIRFGNDG